MISNDSMTEDIINKIKHFQHSMNVGMRVSGKEVTDVYNEVFNRHVPSTNCASCIRRRVGELIKELNKYGERKI